MRRLSRLRKAPENLSPEATMKPTNNGDPEPRKRTISNATTRECTVKNSTGNPFCETYNVTQDPARFHGWTKYPRCAIGDGSMIEWVTLAIIERPDGKVDFCEPTDLLFTNPARP